MLVLVLGSPAGAATLKEYPTPTEYSDPLRVTALPDGTVWFT
jgi:streptogramin lyase